MKVLEGTLEAFALPDVFRLLAHNRLTGALKITRESGDGTVYFREGEVYYAFSSLTREFLGQRLVKAKLITQGQLLRILDEQKRSGSKRIGDILVDKGILSEELLDTFLKEQIQDAIFQLLQWDVGMFVLEAGETSSQEVGLSVSVENLIMESSRRMEEWEVIRRKIPTVDVVVRMSPSPPEDAMEINIKPEEWTLLVMADGRRSVGDIAAAAERSEFETCKILYGLITAGLLDAQSGPAPSADRIPSVSVPRQEVAGPAEAPGDDPPEPAPAAQRIEVEETPEEVAYEAPKEAPEEFPGEAEYLAPEPVLETSGPESLEEASREETLAVASAAEYEGNGSTAEAAQEAKKSKKPGEGISKEMLARLIAGVRKL